MSSDGIIQDDCHTEEECTPFEKCDVVLGCDQKDTPDNQSYYKGAIRKKRSGRRIIFDDEPEVIEEEAEEEDPQDEDEDEELAEEEDEDEDENDEMDDEELHKIVTDGIQTGYNFGWLHGARDLSLVSGLGGLLVAGAIQISIYIARSVL